MSRLEKVRAGRLITAQKRTGRRKPYVVYEGEHVFKGPYAIQSGLLEERVAFLRKHGYGCWLSGEPVRDVDGTWWYRMPRLGADPAAADPHREAPGMGGHTVRVARRAGTGLRTGMEVWRADPALFWRGMAGGAFETLAALYCLRVGDTQPGSNFVWDGDEPYWIDLEETFTLRRGYDVASLLFKSAQAKLRADMERWVRENADLCRRAAARLVELAPDEGFRRRAGALLQAIVRAAVC